MNTLGIIFIAIAGVIAIPLTYLYAVKMNRENEAERIPGPDEIEIVEDGEYHEVVRGDFYIRDSRNDYNPFESYNVFRIDEIRKNVYGDLWVKYTAPGYDCNFIPKWKELECPLNAFLKGKVRVQKIKKR